MNLSFEEIHNQGLIHYKATQDRILVMPPSFLYPKIDYEDAYAIASEMVKEYAANGKTVSGKKVGLTSNAMRRLAGIQEPDYGFIFYEDCFPNEAVIHFETFCQPGVEAELAFKLKSDLEGDDITEEDVLAATEYIVPCLEIVDIRQKNDKQRTIFDTVADNASFGGYVLGDRPIRPYETNLGMISFIFEKNNRQVETSCGAAILDGPEKSIAWLARKFTSLGSPLRKGEIILAGSAVTALSAKKGDHFCCKYGKYGNVSVSFI